MLDTTIRKKLESLTQLPTIPFVISEILNAVDNTDLSAARLAELIERDQALTARVLRVANSPLYGFSRRIATIDLAVVVLGLNTLKEILLSLVLQRFFFSIRRDMFDVGAFWHYSVFSGACSRVLARRLGYRVSGEAFVAGLMHDVGILIMVEYFTKQYMEIRSLETNGYTMIQAEKLILKNTHCEIGAWLADRWNLPKQLCETIHFHHSKFLDYKQMRPHQPDRLQTKDAESHELLIAIIALSEWFAAEMGYRTWTQESKISPLFLAEDFIEELKKDDILNPESALEAIKQEILSDYQKSVALNEVLMKT